MARDGNGRLDHVRGPKSHHVVPRLFLGRSAEGNVFAFGADVPAETALRLETALRAEPLLAKPDAESPPQCRDAVRQGLGSIEAEWRGPAYVLPEGLAADPRARLIGPDDFEACRPDFAWVEAEFPDIQPVAMAFEEGRPVAVCHSPRGLTRLAAEAGVETLEPCRRRGLARAVVACWARAVQQSGRNALYSTSWDNLASQAVARSLGARLYGEDWHVR